MFFEQLNDRSLFEISGEDAENFLENIITCQIAGIEPGAARFGALLTPQGKILFDFFIVRLDGGFLVDVPEAISDDFIKRLMFYRLRAKVNIDPYDEKNVVFAVWSEQPPSIEGSIVVADPRLARMGWRIYAEETPHAESASYKQHRISVGIPEGGRDFSYGDAFPHETLMDQIGGVDFQKGCFVGQEVVSRMQHRGTARKRILQVSANTPLPPTGTTIKADGAPVGTLGSVDGNSGLALLRLDRVALSQSEGKTLAADATLIEATIPDWAEFEWPEVS